VVNAGFGRSDSIHALSCGPRTGRVGTCRGRDGLDLRTVERLLADPEVRVYEIDGSEAWTKLASGYHWT